MKICELGVYARVPPGQSVPVQLPVPNGMFSLVVEYDPLNCQLFPSRLFAAISKLLYVWSIPAGLISIVCELLSPAKAGEKSYQVRNDPVGVFPSGPRIGAVIGTLYASYGRWTPASA